MDFPKHMPNSGERVDADPANMIRDVFFANEGRIPVALVENMVGRHTFTYGHKINEAWAAITDHGPRGLGAVVRDGNDYVWPLAVPTGRIGN